MKEYIFIKKIDTQNGMNIIDAEGILNEIPSGYVANGKETITYFEDHVIFAIRCRTESASASN